MVPVSNPTSKIKLYFIEILKKKSEKERVKEKKRKEKKKKIGP